MSRSVRPLADRFHALVQRFGDDECWRWRGCVSPNGYGRFSVTRGRLDYAHRIAYMLARGPIAVGGEIDHLCHNRGCVNPAHLEAVTKRENILRGDGPSAENARKRTCPQGHPYSGQNCYGYRICRPCANEAERARRRRTG